MTPTHYAVSNGATVFVKEAEFFVSQGGLTAEWGKSWAPFVATSIGDARRKAAQQFGLILSSIYWDEA